MSKESKLFSWLGFGKKAPKPDSTEPAEITEAADSPERVDNPEPVDKTPEPMTSSETEEKAEPVTSSENESAPKSAADYAPQSMSKPEPVQANKPGLLARLRQGLSKTSQNLGAGLASLFSGRKIDDELYEELETQLLLADVGVETTQKLISQLTQHADRKALKDADLLYQKLQQDMATLLQDVEQPLVPECREGPFVILMVGVNGVGKTTTIGKMAQQFKQQGKTVMLAAGDTFRAAAVEQLQVWGERNQIPVVAQHTGADSASVIFDAYQAARARKADVLIADTAGRLQNKAHLMEELKKIVRVLQKIQPDAPHEVMLTLDAGTGQNALSQARIFNQAVPLTGISLTKLDGTAKGGVIFAIADQFKVPIRYIGVGEGIDDLRTFHSTDFIQALFNKDS
ncbi:signal recognition particle-docking protein FtsY [Alkalimonas sp.]|uniref:signal recognition particle-docking protein FtsY n=1 Tax=Alkalimonas sp. TaxID=1872453 RepID=UPI00263A6A8B|nr:signal recognition particle-docking protein FtsY [Alkalimonas sp.]MCC5825157.1 signal recognition particle-docking protein FtsY [Alkalimonas sp.]